MFSSLLEEYILSHGCCHKQQLTVETATDHRYINRIPLQVVCSCGVQKLITSQSPMRFRRYHSTIVRRRTSISVRTQSLISQSDHLSISVRSSVRSQPDPQPDSIRSQFDLIRPCPISCPTSLDLSSIPCPTPSLSHPILPDLSSISVRPQPDLSPISASTSPDLTRSHPISPDFT
ncbi:hypothetical protein EVAR_52394_1 [Eumeta japonica]|uniref:Uncharacterized protein n=1 Tax=Eumeta variegata TaxID=151549 RepID=A0A4C1ZHS9_EUMVA|nr:hypothetical protein EVAR_52394_1 [Eumeta japonica]